MSGRKASVCNTRDADEEKMGEERMKKKKHDVSGYERVKYWLLRRSGVDGVTVREKGLKVSGSVVARGEDCHPNASTGSTAASAR